MRHSLCSLTATAALLLAPLTAFAAPEIGHTAPDFSVTDINGTNVKLSQLKGKTVVLEWNNPECPFVKKHYESNNMQQLQTEAVKDGVVWLTINSGAEGKQGALTRTQALSYMRDSQLGASNYILDPAGKIGQEYAAKVTPHMYVIDKEGRVAYMGAIDDKADTSQDSIQGAKNYVREALENLKEGKPVATATTQPYGCSVKYKS